MKNEAFLWHMDTKSFSSSIPGGCFLLLFSAFPVIDIGVAMRGRYDEET